MPAQVVVLGGGVGGTLTANLLARQPGRNLHVTVVDPTGMHVYQPGFLYAALGKANGRWLARDERTLLHRDVELVVEAATLVQPVMERRGIGLETFFNVETVDPSARTVSSLEGDTADYDLLVLVPPHRGQQVIEASGLGDAGGWVPTDRATLAHRDHERIFALGDATDLPISKSGSTAHFEAPVVASRIASLLRGTAPKANYGGRVMCFLETGDGRATALRFDYQHPPVPP